MRKIFSSRMLLALFLFLAPCQFGFAWDLSEEQKRLQKLNGPEIIGEFEKGIRTSNKQKAYEAYMVFRQKDQAASRELYMEFERKFGPSGYAHQNLLSSSSVSEREEARVIMAFLNENVKNAAPVLFSDSPLNSNNLTRDDLNQFGDDLAEMVPEIQSCFHSFIFFNQGMKRHLSEFLKDEKSVSIIPMEERDTFFPGNSEQHWSEFQKKYPKAEGYFLFSKVGFDAPLQRAFFKVSLASKPGNARTEYQYYEKIDGIWKQICEKKLDAL